MNIRNCKIQYRCDTTWDSLIETDKPKLRHCKNCNENVHLCNSSTEIEDAIRQNKCIAISPQEEEFIGILLSPYEWRSTEG